MSSRVAQFTRLCLLKEASGPNGRPHVRSLVLGQWMKDASRANPQAVTAAYLRQQRDEQDSGG